MILNLDAQVGLNHLNNSSIENSVVFENEDLIIDFNLFEKD